VTRPVVLLGATGTIGRATRAALVARGHDVICLIRPGARPDPVAGAVTVDFTDSAALARAMRGAGAVISCMASRTGAPRDAWAVDHGANLAALNAAVAAGVGQFTLLSAICVQKPLLEFQRAKLAFETALQGAPITWSIVRPTAFFKSLSGQVARVQAGKAFVVFADGALTACKPISDRDLGRYLVDTLHDPAMHGRILPIGGPGPALTPRAQGEMLFDLTGRPRRFKSVPVALMDAIIGGLSLAGKISPRAADKAEFARIGRYYATESMLVWDGARYDADQTPEYGTDSLRDHYAALLRGDLRADLGDHAVF
jgi:divinyl chlorophyllide a 8-vinyl-reductase